MGDSQGFEEHGVEAYNPFPWPLDGRTVWEAAGDMKARLAALREQGKPLEKVFDDSEARVQLEELKANAKTAQEREELEKLFNDSVARKRNRFVRQHGLVEYRCERDCFLGAVVNLRGEWWVIQRGNRKFHPFFDGGEPPKSIEDFRRLESEEERGSGDEPGRSNVCTYMPWALVTHYGNGLYSPLMHCEHSSEEMTAEQVEADIEALRKEKKKTIRIPRD